MDGQQNIKTSYQLNIFRYILKWHTYIIAFVFIATLVAYFIEPEPRFLFQEAIYLFILMSSALSYYLLSIQKNIVAKRLYIASYATILLLVSNTTIEILLTLNIAIIAYFIFIGTILDTARWIYFWSAFYLGIHYLGLALRWYFPLEGYEIEARTLQHVIIWPLFPLAVFVPLSYAITRIISDLAAEKFHISDQNKQLYHQAKIELDERIRTAEQLRLLSTAIEQSNSSVVITDRQGIITYVNPAFSDITGYTAEEVIGEHTRILNANITPSSEYTPLWQAITQGDSWQGEFLNKKKDGEIFWEIASVSPIRNDDGKITNFLALKEDITARKKAEQALVQNEKYLRSILKNSPIGIFIIQENGRIVLSNATVENLFGYTQEEFQSLELEDLIPPHLRSIHQSHRLDYFKDPHSRDTQYIMAKGLELHGIHKDQTIIPLQIILQYLEFEDEPSTIAFVHDISQQQAFEEQRLEFLLEKERINILAHFIRNAAHEFRTPLSIIQTNAYLMQQIDVPQEKEKYRQSIEDQVDMVTRLLDNLITMTRLDNVHAYPLELYNVNSLVRDLLISSESWLQPKNLSIDANLEEDLPKIGLNTSDVALALQQILTNAIQYSPLYGVITIGTFFDERFVGLKISDQGQGIAPDLIDRIFERFYRVDETHDERGFGLGLSIAKKICELHQGKIEVDSEVDVGTTVTLYLPIVSGSMPNANQSEMYTL